jgi:hypothetical protein
MRQEHVVFKQFMYFLKCDVGRGSSVGIVTRYGLHGPGIAFRWRQYFPHASRPVLGPTHPYVQWVTGHSRGVIRPGREADHPPLSSAEVKERGELRVCLHSPSVPSWQVKGNIELL